jgi:hypothetical protein
VRRLGLALAEDDTFLPHAPWSVRLEGEKPSVCVIHDAYICVVRLNE